MKANQNVKPRNLGGGPTCRSLALIFWVGVALFTFGPLLFMFAFFFVWMHPDPVTALEPLIEATAVQATLIVVIVAPLYFAPGIRRLAHSARFVLLGPVAGAIDLAVLLYLEPQIG